MEKRKAKILIAEDEAHIRSLISLIVSSLGAEVVGEASDGEQAMILYRQFRPDMVILDINMPKLDGVAANANNYSLPTATGSTLGGIKIGSSLAINAGVVDVPAAGASQAGVQKYMQAETFTGNGAQTGFTVVNNIGNYLAVFQSGLRQTPTDDYTVSGKTITFLSAPLTGQKIIIDYVPA